MTDNMNLNIEIEGNNVKATLVGRLDTAASSQFATDMLPLIENADKTISLICNDLEFISSSGLRHLLTLRKATMAKGGKVVIYGINAEIEQVFNITGFKTLFEFA